MRKLSTYYSLATFPANVSGTAAINEDFTNTATRPTSCRGRCDAECYAE